MSEEMKPRTFRISEEVTEKFKQVCTDFENQNAALDGLINAYELQSSKLVLSDRQTEIEDYDTHIQAIQRAFLYSLELNKNAEQRIRAEYQNLLTSKDDMIMLLQQQKSEMEERLRIAEENEKIQLDKVKLVQEEHNKLIESLTNRLNNAEQSRRSSDETAEALKVTNSLLSENLENIKRKSEETENHNNKLSEQYEVLKNEFSELQKIVKEKEKELSETAIALERAEVEKEKMLFEERSKSTEKLQSLYEELDNLRKKIQNLTSENLKLKAKK